MAEPQWIIDGTTAVYGTENETLVTITGLKNEAPVSGLSINGTEIIIANSVLNQSTVTVSSGYTLKLADDVAKTSTTAAGWTISGTTATYKAAATSAGYSVSNDGRTISYSGATGGNTLVTVTGVKSNAPTSGLSLSGNVVTLSNFVLNQSAVTVSTGYTLKLADDVAKTSTTPAAWSVSGTTATYTAAATSAGYSVSNDGRTISYSGASGGNTLVTVTGVKSNAPTSGLSLSGNVVTLSNAVLNQNTVTVSTGYTLKLADDVTKTATTAAGWTLAGTTATYKSASTAAGYALENNQVSYVSASGGETLATVSGVKSLDGIKISGNIVKIDPKIIVSKGATVTGSGYTFELSGSGKIEAATSEVTLKGSKANDVLINTGENVIIYGEAGDDTLTGGSGKNTLTGGAGKDVFVHGGGEDFITDYAEGDKIKISGGTITGVSVVESDVVFNVGDGSITVRDGRDKKITRIDSKLL